MTTGDDAPDGTTWMRAEPAGSARYPVASPKAAPFTTRAPFTSTSTGGASGER